MLTTTLQLLPTTTFGTPSGNYDGSSLDWNGTRQQAANYYGGFGDLQTLAFYFANFQGLVRIQATLDSNPTSDSNWFDVSEYNSTSSPISSNFSRNVEGNFTWIRARVENFTAGTITKIMLSY